jgi:hypothetical protein
MLPPFAADDVLIEGLMLTRRPAVAGVEGEPSGYGEFNLAPMGPVVSPGFERFTFRPFKSASTYRNLKATGQAVFHVTDDACLIARAAVSRLVIGVDVEVQPARVVEGLVIKQACRAYELQVESIDDSHERTTIIARPVHVERLRDFLGFNRARHALIEAAILATRLHLTGTEVVLAEYSRLQVPVDKTGSAREAAAFAGLVEYVKAWKPRDA